MDVATHLCAFHDSDLDLLKLSYKSGLALAFNDMFIKITTVEIPGISQLIPQTFFCEMSCENRTAHFTK